MATPLTFRQATITKPTSTTTKNAPLSNVEIDGNMHSIQDAITVIESDNWVTGARIGDSQISPAKLSVDYDGFKTKINNHTTATGSTIIASGTTAQRDATAYEGYFRYNTTLGRAEWRSATSWIGVVKENDIVYIGTTAVQLNRGNASMTLTGISVDGNAGTVTNGVYTTGNQTIGGDKTFSNVIIGSTNTQVSLTGDQSIGGTKTFSNLKTLILKFGDGLWTATQSGNGIIFAYDGINKMKIDVNGNLTTTGNITAYGTL